MAAVVEKGRASAAEPNPETAVVVAGLDVVWGRRSCAVMVLVVPPLLRVRSEPAAADGRVCVVGERVREERARVSEGVAEREGMDFVPVIRRVVKVLRAVLLVGGGLG